MTNPFDATSDPDRHAIWHLLIVKDSEAFLATDFSLLEPDFDAENFEGIRCGHSYDPGDWRIAFPNLADYRDEWLVASQQFLQKKFTHHTHREALYARCRMTEIEILGDRALAHKKFSGTIPVADGTQLTVARQTLYRLHKQSGRWRIVGFLGQLPLDPP